MYRLQGTHVRPIYLLETSIIVVWEVVRLKTYRNNPYQTCVAQSEHGMTRVTVHIQKCHALDAIFRCRCYGRVYNVYETINTRNKIVCNCLRKFILRRIIILLALMSLMR